MDSLLLHQMASSMMKMGLQRECLKLSAHIHKEIQVLLMPVIQPLSLDNEDKITIHLKENHNYHS